MLRSLVLLLVLAAACVGGQTEPELRPQAGLLPGSIGVAVKRDTAGVVVAAVKKDGGADTAGMRAGDVVLRYNGASVSSLREFNRLVIDSPPGSTARVELLRDGKVHQVEVPVRELDTMPRV
jgi:S1-C subfamily serine protease